MIKDNFGRPLNSLRIQLNATCNFKCFFCHMEGTEENTKTMSLEEIEKVIKAASQLGVKRIKFTGGEPLLRRDILEIIKVTRKYIDGDISLTTNGYFLEGMAVKLKEAGLNRVNISLHAMTPESFKTITGIGSLNVVKEGAKAAVRAGLNPVKLNMVILKGINDGQIFQLLDFAREIGAMVQFIELESPREKEKEEWFRRFHVSLDFIEDLLKPYLKGIEYNSLHKRRILILDYNGSELKVEIVNPHRNHDFCMNCTRLRITSTGSVQTCIHRPDQRISIDYNNTSESLIVATKMREPYW